MCANRSAASRSTVELDGVVIGTAESDDVGDWEIPVPGAGTYLVRLEVDTLPDGVALTDPEKFELPTLSVRANQNKTARFNLGPGLESGVSAWTRVSSLFVIGLKFGAIIALSSVGLSLIFGVTGLVNFAHGDLVTLGAVLAFLFNASPLGPGVHILLAAIPAILLVAAFGGLQEIAMWRPLRRRGTGLVSLIVVSIGLSFVIRYGILIAFSGLPRPYRDYAIQNDIQVLGITTVPKNLVIIVFTVVVLALVGLFLTRTKLGTAMRAVADNADLAESSGIDVVASHPGHVDWRCRPRRTRRRDVRDLGAGAVGHGRQAAPPHLLRCDPRWPGNGVWGNGRRVHRRCRYRDVDSRDPG